MEVIKKYSVKVNGISYDVEIEELGTKVSSDVKNTIEKKQAPSPSKNEVKSAEITNNTAPKDGTAVKAPMPGKILSIKCSEGAFVKKGEVLMILEAMKMENEITSVKDGKVLSINVSENDVVQGEDTLAIIA